MQHMEMMQSTGAFRFTNHARQYLEITFRVDENSDIAPTDVLCHEDFRETGLANSGRTQYQRVSNPLADIHADMLLVF